MYATDFEYDGRWLSDYNCIVCNFDGSSGTEIINAGSSIVFNKITRNMEEKILLREFNMTNVLPQLLIFAKIQTLQNRKIYHLLLTNAETLCVG